MFLMSEVATLKRLDLEKINRGVSGYLSSHDSHHLLSDSSDLVALSVGGLLDLVLSLLGETNGEESKLGSKKFVPGRLSSEFSPVSGGDVNVGLDLGLPLLDHGALLVSGELHTVEVGEAVVALNLLADESELLVGALVTVEVSLVDLVDSASETISGEL